MAVNTTFPPNVNTVKAIYANTQAIVTTDVYKTYAGTNVGSEFWIKKTFTSSAITYLTAVDMTGVSSGGELAITDVILKTDGTGLAVGTNFKVITNNAKGNPIVLQNAVSGLGASTTVDLTGAGITKIRTVLENGKKIQVQSTVADCTGAGTIDVYVKLQRLTAGATIAAL